MTPKYTQPFNARNLQEMLGFNVSYAGVGPSTPTGYYAIAGCTDPSNGVDPGCGATVLGRSEKRGETFSKTWGKW